MRKIKLVCIPYAGGSVYCYNRWNKYLDSSIEMVFLELKGRGKRFNEEFDDSMREVVDDLYYQMKDIIHDGNYAIFGHSMGSIIAYELTKKIQGESDKTPLHVIYSGCISPKYKSPVTYLYNAPIEELKAYFITLGRTTEEVFNNEELSKIFIPIIRSDLKILNGYKFDQNTRKLTCNASVFWGDKDFVVDCNKIVDWQTYHIPNINFYRFSGGHFYIFDCLFQVVMTINSILLKLD